MENTVLFKGKLHCLKFSTAWHQQQKIKQGIYYMTSVIGKTKVVIQINKTTRYTKIPDVFQRGTPATTVFHTSKSIYTPWVLDYYCVQ